MVVHKNIAMHINWIEIYTLGKNLQKFTPVIIVVKDFSLQKGDVGSKTIYR